ncbi:hypothetical protein H072_3434 [Dactylellina haptotyla CBS 200.50]|uniref:Subtelomeric hrmA-associated cluster protein AFUB-079030/YDR124W-like helical bundle domain-containing protein n=1 Tax=Dactylellina haptotyla (strain CBS 200.50) TaxID=1284197 RepID=S8ANA9_DACHA|nr:hypothetical protein H072_3434 [Dactylellina haptotyla CBS 200.50]
MVNRDITPQVLGALRHNFPIETQFAVLAVTADGKISIHASDVLKPYCDRWYNDDIRKEALAAVATIPSRKRSHVALSVNTTQPGSGSEAGSQAIVNPTQMISPPPEVPMEDCDPNEDQASLSSASTGRPKKKPRRASTDSPSQSINTSATPPKKMRQRKVGVTKLKKATTFIKKEANDMDGDKDWETMENPANEARDEDMPREDEEIEEEPPLVPLCIGKQAEVATYLWRKFVQIQQLDCKVIAKAWVKVIEPKKQAHSPYNGGDATRPWWWPVDAPHKEPDHLLKNARIRVLVSCISDQLVPISLLRAATDDTSLRPSQKEILHEMYDVMELDQRMRAGNLDRDYVRYVRPFVKGNKRRKPRTLKSQQPTLKGRSKKTAVKEEAANGIVRTLDSEVPMASFFKSEEEESEDSAAVQNARSSSDALRPADTPASDSHQANGRRQSTGVISGTNPADTSLLNFQYRSNSLPSVQHASGIFNNSYIPFNQPFNDQKMDNTDTDSPQQPFEITPSPTTSPGYTQITTSPGIPCPILTPASATSTTSQSTGYPFADMGSRSIFNAIVSPSTTDINIMGNDSDMFSPVMSTSSYNSDAYTAYALHELQPFQNYPRTYFPNPALQDTNMLESSNNFTPTFP